MWMAAGHRILRTGEPVSFSAAASQVRSRPGNHAVAKKTRYGVLASLSVLSDACHSGNAMGKQRYSILPIWTDTYSVLSATWATTTGTSRWIKVQDFEPLGISTDDNNGLCHSPCIWCIRRCGCSRLTALRSLRSSRLLGFLARVCFLIKIHFDFVVMIRNLLRLLCCCMKWMTTNRILLKRTDGLFIGNESRITRDRNVPKSEHSQQWCTRWFHYKLYTDDSESER